MGKNPSKVELLTAIAELQMLVGRLLVTSETHKNAGRLKKARVDYGALIDALKRMLTLEEQNNHLFPDTPFSVEPTINTLLNILPTQADVVAALGDYAMEERLRGEYLALSEKYLPGAANAERKRQHAVSLVPKGRFNEALVAFFEARDLFERQGDKLSVASVTSDVAGILEWLGDYERALQEAKRALELLGPLTDGKTPTMRNVFSDLVSGKLKEAQEHANLLRIALDLEQTVARSYRRLGKFDEAERRFRKVVPHLPPDIAEAGIGFQLAAILVESAHFSEGLEALRHIEPFFSGLVRPKLGVLLSFEAEALLGLGRAKEALVLAEKACKELRQYRDPDSEWKTDWRRARALVALGRTKDAMDAYMDSAKIVHQLRKAPLGYRLDSLYLKDKLPMLADAITLASRLHDSETACRLMEWVKSRTLTAALSLSQAKAAPASGGELESKIDNCSRLLDALEYQSFASGLTAEIEEKRAILQEERAQFLERMRITDPRWRALSEPVTFSLDKVLSLLQSRKQAALSLFLNNGRVVAVLLAEGRCVAEELPLSPDTLAALSAYQKNLQSLNPDPKAFDPGLNAALAASRLVPAALLDRALAAGSLVVVPHGPLHLLPWAGLEYGGKRLFGYCPVGILPNLSCLAALGADPSASPPRVALIGAPDYRHLPKLMLAQAEMETISDLYGAAVIEQALSGAQATEEGFRQLAVHEKAHGGILHIACHGDFVLGDPMGAGLQLTDGKMDAAEISQMKLQYGEVILSACSSGYRPTEIQNVPLTGDDILGLPGAFLEAGAHSILVSIPSARDDATLDFMTRYHEYRLKNNSPLVSCRMTQLAMASEGAFEPHLWVGFSVYGCR